ncbi:MAG: M48 family metallopeptidase [Verrucomicrobiales bacterium]|nr:M48 family metallopeptidase [Verrucomicrobiales bacterium]
MDFFEHQEQARKKSKTLVFYFILAVTGIVAAVCATVTAVLVFTGNSGGSILNPGVLAGTAAGTVALIFAGSGYKSLQLSAGGKVVAKELGGRLVDSSTTDYYERRLINVVEEMSIASGVPVPEVYVMDDEDSINAFAAGKTTSDAVVGVTRGCMKLLTREELQGVIAHEFSHILNGDMRLNMRLIGLLFGIMFLALIGQMMLRGAANTARYSRNRESGSGALVILVLGLALMLIGYIGMFFAKMIKSAVSRQREFLADASAVQFTRNPDGIGGALKKIGGLTRGSMVGHPMAEEASHMFFGSALNSQMFATHPPLPIRIQRVDPSWDGNFPKTTMPEIAGDPDDLERHGLKPRKGEKDRPRPERRGIPIPVPIPGVSMAHSETPMTQAQAIESMSHVHREQIEFGQDLHGKFPEHWYQAAHQEGGAQALLFALLLAQDDSLRNAELSQLRQMTGEATFEATTQLNIEIRELHSSVKLALIDLAIPTLRRLSPDEYKRFRTVLEKLMSSDKRIDLFEFTLQKVVRRHLDNYFGHANPFKIRYRKIARLEDEAAVLITTLAALGNQGDEAGAKEAFSEGATLIQNETYGTLEFKPASECGLQQIEAALDKFAESTPLVKKRLLHAAGRTVMADQKVTSEEAELIRAIADAIGCPIPPFVKTGHEAASAAA